MVTKLRSPGQTAISVSIPLDLLAEVDKRAAALGLSRSVYLALLARKDLVDGGDLTLKETPVSAAQQAANDKAAAAVIKTSYLKKRGPK